MPGSLMTLADGGSLSVNHASLTYVQLRGIVFENLAIPTGVPITKATGNPPAWIEFDASILIGEGRTRSVKQANIVSIGPEAT